ncbi:unnamed protein product [Chironomus riparius]|uniref:Odorant receptor n=1 Tax=Chironomus riparius TaxID=315576 RepID=A0A9N9S056_9DIPT|nr:unnamed protein product [Chironomus riparius]
MLIENALVAGIYFVVLFKIIIVNKNNVANILEVVKKLDEYFPHSGVDQLNFNVHKYLNTAKWVEKLFYSMIAFIVSHLSMIPYLHQLYGYVKSESVDWELILNLNLSFDLLQPFVYEMMCLSEILMMIAAAIYIVSTDLLFANLVHVLAMEFDILSVKISEIGIIENEKEAIKELKNLIDIHQDLIETSQKLNDIYSLLQLINAFGTIVAFCTGSFLAVQSNLLYNKRTLLRGALGLGALGLGALGLGAIGLGALGLGALGVGALRLGAIGLGAIGLGAIGLGAIGLGAIGLGAIGLGAIGLGAIGLGAIGLGAIGLGAIGLGAIGLGAIGLGAIGLRRTKDLYLGDLCEVRHHGLISRIDKKLKLFKELN